MRLFRMKAVKLARPLMVAVIGTTIVFAGIVTIVLPLPGLPLILAGLAILSTEFAWAKSLLAWMKKMLLKIRERFPRQ